MPESNWSPWQPTEVDLTLARSVYADYDRADFAFRGLAGVDALVAAFENGDWITFRRVVRTMRAYVAVDQEGPAIPAAPRPVSEIVSNLRAEIDAIVTEHRTRADAA